MGGRFAGALGGGAEGFLAAGFAACALAFAGALPSGFLGGAE